LILTPEQFGLQRTAIDTLVVKDAEQSLKLMREVLADSPGPARDIVMLNAGAAIYAAGLADSMGQGVDKARGVIADGAARRKLDELVALSNQLTQ